MLTMGVVVAELVNQHSQAEALQPQEGPRVVPAQPGTVVEATIQHAGGTERTDSVAMQDDAYLRLAVLVGQVPHVVDQLV